MSTAENVILIAFCYSVVFALLKYELLPCFNISKILMRSPPAIGYSQPPHFVSLGNTNLTLKGLDVL